MSKQDLSKIVALSVVCAVLLPSTTHAEQPANWGPVSGSCEYSPRVGEFRHQVTLLLCDTVSLNRTGDDVTIEFGKHSWGLSARFSGKIKMSGDTLDISEIAMRDGGSKTATGTC